MTLAAFQGTFSRLSSAFRRSNSQAAVSLTYGVLKPLRKMRSTVKLHFWLSINHSLICEPQVLQGVLRIHVIARFLHLDLFFS